MSPIRRRSVPDNLDPLVDTLSNVVGILVVVIALTQIELGDALSRVLQLDEQRRVAEEVASPTRPGADRALEEGRPALTGRLEEGLEASISAARRALALLETLPEEARVQVSQAPLDADSLRKLGEKLEVEKGKLLGARTRLAQRGKYAAELRSVPARRVARIPDPKKVVGRESWILVRYDRVFLVDREKLFEEARRAINRLLPHSTQRRIRPDEFEAVARYLRKQDIGFGSFRWQLQPGPAPRVELNWRSPDAGIERTRLDSDPALATWLRMRAPEEHAIRFLVWADSFETYLDARQRVEAAGFNAGWRGYEADEELALPLVFGGRISDIRPVPVD